jgi:hypothetical protein
MLAFCARAGSAGTIASSAIGTRPRHARPVRQGSIIAILAAAVEK